MFGLLTGDPALARRDVGDVTYFVADEVDGTRRDPRPDAVNSIACWGDTAAVQADPARAAVAADGTRATPAADGQHWGTVCPTDPAYRERLLDRVETVGARGDVRLTTPGFPGDAYCHCERCDRRFAASEHADRTAWRTATVTEFVADAADRVAGDVHVTLYPDPYPGALRDRAGLDPDRLAPVVDGFLVPLCSATGYETTYWVDVIARGFAARLAGHDAALTFQLSARDAPADRLVDLARAVHGHGDAVVFGTHSTDADTVTDVIDRLRADAAPPA